MQFVRRMKCYILIILNYSVNHYRKSNPFLVKNGKNTVFLFFFKDKMEGNTTRKDM